MSTNETTEEEPQSWYKRLLAKTGISALKKEESDGNGDTNNSEDTSGVDNSNATENERDQSRSKRKSKKDKTPQVGVFELFKFTTFTERIILLFATLVACAQGAALPLFTIVFGDVLQDFSEGADADRILDLSIWFVIIGAASALCGFLQVSLFIYVASAQCTRIRRLYFRALMRQEHEWHDQNETGELTTRVASDVNLIQSGVGEKCGLIVQFLTMGIAGMVLGFFFSWRLSLVILSVTPLLIITAGIMGKLMSDTSGEGQGAYGKAGAIAFEAISMIRSVTAYGGQQEEIGRYKGSLKDAYKAGVRKAHFTGLGFGTTWLVMILVYAVSLYYGSRLVEDGKVELADVMTTFFAVVISAFSVGQAGPGITALTTARGAAPRVFEIIARESAIDPFSEEGERLENFKGKIEFENVGFSYKGRSEKTVLEDLNLDISPGKSLALVGPSGCGKSTIFSLLLRFYDVTSGRILMDGVDVRELNPQWLRSQIGYVSQEPILFGVSVRENIAMGVNSMFSQDSSTQTASSLISDVSDEDIVRAAKIANAHDFILRLPEQYETVLGTGNSQISGGQKQRLCIARGLIREPTILLLDEATAALDSQSEGIVQDALNKASKGRTTVTIAHRLSTIRRADTIAVVNQHRIVEQGSHSELMSLPDGRYRNLVELQEVSGDSKESDETEGSSDHDDEGSYAEVEGVKGVVGFKRKSSIKEPSTSILQRLEVSKEEMVEEKVIDRGVFRRTLKASSKDLVFTALGVLGAIGVGAVMPFLGLIFADVTTELARIQQPEDDGDREDARDRADFLCLMFVVLAVATLFVNWLMFGMTGISGERLTYRMRLSSFKSIMKQEIGFFDMEENQIGALTARLSTEATSMKGLIGGVFGSIAQAVATVSVGLVIALITCWQDALVVLTVLPLAGLGQFLQMKLFAGLDSQTTRLYQDSASIAAEAVSNVRTVTSLGLQKYFCEQFNDRVNKPLKKNRKKAVIQGFFYGFGDATMFLIFFLAFWAGSKFAEDGRCSPANVNRAIFSLVYSSFTFGTLSTQIPDYGASRIASTRIFRLLDRKSKIDPTSTTGSEISEAGAVELKEVEFEYPRRPEIPVLRKMSLPVEPGQTVALVGGSGSGKSTVVSLIERFYDPRGGEVDLDSKDLRNINVRSARDQMSIVFQEALLFNVSIRENIAYGFPKTEGTVVTDEQIVDSARAANAHDFITSLPDQYDTICGERGCKLSGGQRQRVALARALVRSQGNSVLLLDEATSALDARNEAIIQEALERAVVGRTTVIVAHRLSTVKNADKICVVARGKIVESGTHSELMVQNGAYAALIAQQMTVSE